MNYIFSNKFWSLDHPLINQLRNDEISVSEMMKQISDTDPIIVQPLHKKDTIRLDIVTKQDRDGTVVEYPARFLAGYRSKFGITKEQILKYRDVISTLLPECKETYNTLSDDIDCVECQLQPIRKIIHTAVLSNTLDVDKLIEALPLEGLHPLSIALLRRQNVSDNEILEVMPPHPYLNFKTYPTVERICFFDSEDCGKGYIKENCSKCRHSHNHRLSILKKYTIPPTVKVPTVDGDLTMVVNSSSPYTPEDFKCPYIETVQSTYPSIAKEGMSLLKSMGQVVQAVCDNKSIMISPIDKQKRLNICTAGCEFYNKDEVRCSECGCYLNIKATLSTKDCPRWPAPGRIVTSCQYPNELWIAGYPSFYGGADTELFNIIRLLRDYDVKVHLVPMFGQDLKMRGLCDLMGCKTHLYRSDIFKDKVVASFCNGEFLKLLPEICQSGRPATVVWFNSMTWTFEDELTAHARGYIDYFGFVSNYQKQLILPKLNTVRPVHEFVGYKPHFAIEDEMFKYTPPTDKFIIGRVSRDDQGKYPSDLWETYSKITSPLPLQFSILGFGEHAREKCGSPPEHLTTELFEPNTMRTTDFYHKLHCIIHKTGGSRESYCRIVPEAYAHGVPIIVENDYAFPELIIDRETGFLCNSSEEMAEVASELASNEALREKIIRQGYDHLKNTLVNEIDSLSAWQQVLKI